eukprot:CAMPEP_0114595026 /NCGR_PEP_ID=MMETSP0125-20121206/16748_1 /TAXON_ID=485358 ORGANISM="Aristerostoma sp., Strain ATCC 50986" /NCGR_SAMPLE_ID=MMETSP0125 /ASSEMBLY_ACC=CAM_ASM_000245 /LENGTH=39 /DNA_ID= /DNA_START= /DNA_END= /DNA_ORIENTATION=
MGASQIVENSEMMKFVKVKPMSDADAQDLKLGSRIEEVS